MIWLTSSRLCDLMVLMPSMPDSASSIGVVITLSTTCAVAPLYTVRTDTMGGSIFGYSRTDRRSNEMMPSSTIIKLITVASTGRLIEMSDRTKGHLPRRNR